MIRQGITEIEHIPCLGTKVEHIRAVFKGFNTLELPDARGGVIFGAMQYTRLHALVSFVQDKQRCGQNVNPVDFTAPIMESSLVMEMNIALVASSKNKQTEATDLASYCSSTRT